jgi:acyl carrier protein
MSDLEQRLARAFTIAFPGLSAEAALQASPTSVAEWDSIGAINLASVVAEEFEIDVDLELLPDLTSFDAFHQLVQSQLAKRAAGQGR